MSGKHSAVLWLGLLLIAAQFFFGGQWQILFGTIKATGPSNSPSKNTGGGGGGGFRAVSKRTG
jgi:hypothetical protein